MATKIVSSNDVESVFYRENADDLKINVEHVKSSLTNQEIMSYMNDFIICLEDMLINPPTTLKNVTHVVSTKTYYGV